MSKKIVVWGAVAAVVGVGGFVALPYAMGTMAESKFDAAMTELKHPYMQWRKISYDRGLYGAEARSEIVIGDAGDSATISFKHTISHAPFAGGGVASIITELELQPEVQADLEKVFGDQAPLVFKTNVGFGGGSVTEFSSSAFDVEKDGEHIISAGLNGTIETDGRRVVIDGKFPKLEGKGTTSFAITDLTLTGDMTQAADEHWFGNVEMNLAGFNVQDPNGPGLSLEALHLDEQVTEQNAELLATVVNFTAKKLAVDEYTVTDAKFQMEMKNIDRAALKSYTDDLTAVGPGASPEASASAIMESMMKNGVLLLKRSPQLNNSLSFSMPQGKFDGKFDINFNGEGEFALSPDTLLMRSGVTASVDVSKALLEGMVPAEVYAGFVSEGMLQDKGDVYTGTAALKEGMISVNGKEMGPLPMMF